MRPKSIVLFEYSYLGAILLSAANEAMNWKITNSAQVQAALGSSAMPLFMVFIYTLSLLLWYFTARSASVFAKWGVVIFFGFSLLGVGTMLATGSWQNDLAGGLRVGALVLNAIAVYLLFRPDARAWFGEAA